MGRNTSFYLVVRCSLFMKIRQEHQTRHISPPPRKIHQRSPSRNSVAFKSRQLFVVRSAVCFNDLIVSDVSPCRTFLNFQNFLRGSWYLYRVF